jgi:hypothetical protein
MTATVAQESVMVMFIELDDAMTPASSLLPVATHICIFTYATLLT